VPGDWGGEVADGVGQHAVHRDHFVDGQEVVEVERAVPPVGVVLVGGDSEQRAQVVREVEAGLGGEPIEAVLGRAGQEGSGAGQQPLDDVALEVARSPPAGPLPRDADSAPGIGRRIRRTGRFVIRPSRSSLDDNRYDCVDMSAQSHGLPGMMLR
jgi:hypothetical protein